MNMRLCQRPFDVEKDRLVCPEGSFLHRDEEGRYRCISDRCVPTEPEKKKIWTAGTIAAVAAAAATTSVFIFALIYLLLL